VNRYEVSPLRSSSIDPDVIASEITFGGTVEWAAAEWLEKQGFAVRFFAVTPEIAVLGRPPHSAVKLLLPGCSLSRTAAPVRLRLTPTFRTAAGSF
jgi:hypothetical protein